MRFCINSFIFFWELLPIFQLKLLNQLIFNNCVCFSFDFGYFWHTLELSVVLRFIQIFSWFTSCQLLLTIFRSAFTVSYCQVSFTVLDCYQLLIITAPAASRPRSGEACRWRCCGCRRRCCGCFSGSEGCGVPERGPQHSYLPTSLTYLRTHLLI